MTFLFLTLRHRTCLDAMNLARTNLARPELSRLQAALAAATVIDGRGKEKVIVLPAAAGWARATMRPRALSEKNPGKQKAQPRHEPDASGLQATAASRRVLHDSTIVWAPGADPKWRAFGPTVSNKRSHRAQTLEPPLDHCQFTDRHSLWTSGLDFAAAFLVCPIVFSSLHLLFYQAKLLRVRLALHSLFHIVFLHLVIPLRRSCHGEEGIRL